MQEVTMKELDEAMLEFDSDEICEMIGRTNTLLDYNVRQQALRAVQREATRRAINVVLKLRESE